jgi:hypothetical protein
MPLSQANVLFKWASNTQLPPLPLWLSHGVKNYLFAFFFFLVVCIVPSFPEGFNARRFCPGVSSLWDSSYKYFKVCFWFVSKWRSICSCLCAVSFFISFSLICLLTCALRRREILWRSNPCRTVWEIVFLSSHLCFKASRNTMAK